MFELDENFFEELGVNKMPSDEAAAFKQHVQEELEARVGEQISDGVSTEKLEEFEKLIDAAPADVENWVNTNTPNYQSDEVFGAIKQQYGGQETSQVLAEYASMKWLQINRPDFTQIIATVTADLKRELQENINKVL